MEAAIHQLDQTVNNWSDYNRIYYHPRTINPIVTHQMDNDITPFDNFTIGKQSYQDNEKEMDIFEDNFRFFVEECDNLQGFQILTDVDDAFGGFSEGLLHNICDEFGKTPIMTYGMSDSHAQYRTDRHKQKIILNRALSITRLADLSSIYVPIYTPTQSATKKCGLSPYMRFNELSRYHTSAIIASAIESNSLPYRLKHNSMTMADAVSKLNWVRTTRLASLSITLPLPISENGYIDTLENSQKMNPALSLLDRFSRKDVYGEILVTRGLPSNMRERTAFLEKFYSNFKDSNDPLQARVSLDCAFPLAETYPRIFTPRVNQNGFITSTASAEPPQSLPVFTRLESGSILKDTLDHNISNLNKIVFKDFLEYNQGEGGLSREDFLETKESLISLSDNYRTDDDNMVL
ncbi:tubulin domain-containing protein [Parasitella parasitica]|nr:tubulin domain-containing protein [Parasitella parasitica]